MSPRSFEYKIRINRDSQGRYQASTESIRGSDPATSVSEALSRLGEPIQVDVERRCNSEGWPDFSLPFFAYGIFKGGELGFLQIADHVLERTPVADPRLGRLWIRDGLPVCIPNGGGDIAVSGDLLRFKVDRSRDAYEQVLAAEPGRLYEWRTGSVLESPCNYLVGPGEDPTRGACKPDMEWSGEKDHFFTTALEMVQEIAWRHGAPEIVRPSRLSLECRQTSNKSIKSTFKLQMAYMLLWASIERYGAFRHGLFKGPMAVVEKIGKENSFVSMIQRIVTRRDKVFAANAARDDAPYELDTSTVKASKASIHYYYQIRCNATHRGKGEGSPDHTKLLNALSELLRIFQHVKTSAFQESRRRAEELTAPEPPDGFKST